jgi:hypothetical protein
MKGVQNQHTINIDRGILKEPDKLKQAWQINHRAGITEILFNKREN